MARARRAGALRRGARRHGSGDGGLPGRACHNYAPARAISSSLYQQASELHADALALAAAEGQAETALAIAENQRALVLRRLLTTERSAIASPNQARHDRLRASITTLIPAAADGDQAAGQRLDQALADYGELLLHARHQQAPTNFTQPPPVALAGTRAALAAAYGSDWTALCFAELPGTLLLYVLTPEELWQHRITVDKTFIGRVGRASRPEFRRLTYRSSTPSQPAPASWKQARALADQLLPPAVRARLHPNHRLLIVPASMLHRLPWPALRVGEAWLAEQAIIQLAPSLATWQLLGRAAPAPGSEALIVGCSEFGSRAAPLRTVPEEVADVARRWPGPSRTLLDAQATRAALLNIPPGELRRYRVLHFATHAQLLPQHGLAAHIQLWDDILLLPEVAALPLDNALVMLSTCDGAATHPLPGEEHFSLAHALLAAGASGVVASVWPVSNEAALGVVKAFYTALQQQPDPASALAHAQRVLMAGAAGDEASLPYGWGGFVFMGH